MSAFRKGHTKVVKWMVKHVSQFPNDQELTRYISTIQNHEKDSAKKCIQAMDIIRVAKDRQAAEAAKNANILLEELDRESKAEQSKKEAAARKREKKKRKKMEKQGIKSGADDDKENSEVITEDEKEKSPEFDPMEEEEEQQQEPQSTAAAASRVAEQPSGKGGKGGNDQQQQQSKATTAAAAANTQPPAVATSGKKGKNSKKKNNAKNASKEDSPDILSSSSGSGKQATPPPPTATMPAGKKETSPPAGTADPLGLRVPSMPESHSATAHAHPANNSHFAENAASSSSNSHHGSSQHQGQESANRGGKRNGRRSDDKFSAVPVISTSGSAAGSLSGQQPSAGGSKKTPASSGGGTTSSKLTSVTSASGASDPSGWKEVGRKSKKVSVPANAISRVIGRGGCNINAIRELSGAHIEVEKQTPKGGTDRTIIIKAPAEATRQAHTWIQAIINSPEKDMADILGKPYKALQQQQHGSIGNFVPPVTTQASAGAKPSTAVNTTAASNGKMTPTSAAASAVTSANKATAGNKTPQEPRRSSAGTSSSTTATKPATAKPGKLSSFAAVAGGASADPAASYGMIATGPPPASGKKSANPSAVTQQLSSGATSATPAVQSGAKPEDHGKAGAEISQPQKPFMDSPASSQRQQQQQEIQQRGMPQNLMQQQQHQQQQSGFMGSAGFKSMVSGASPAPSNTATSSIQQQQVDIRNLNKQEASSDKDYSPFKGLTGGWGSGPSTLVTSSASNTSSGGRRPELHSPVNQQLLQRDGSSGGAAAAQGQQRMGAVSSPTLFAEPIKVDLAKAPGYRATPINNWAPQQQSPQKNNSSSGDGGNSSMFQQPERSNSAPGTPVSPTVPTPIGPPVQSKQMIGGGGNSSTLSPGSDSAISRQQQQQQQPSSVHQQGPPPSLGNSNHFGAPGTRSMTPDSELDMRLGSGGSIHNAAIGRPSSVAGMDKKDHGSSSSGSSFFRHQGTIGSGSSGMNSNKSNAGIGSNAFDNSQFHESLLSTAAAMASSMNTGGGPGFNDFINMLPPVSSSAAGGGDNFSMSNIGGPRMNNPPPTGFGMPPKMNLHTDQAGGSNFMRIQTPSADYLRATGNSGSMGRLPQQQQHQQQRNSYQGFSGMNGGRSNNYGTTNSSNANMSAGYPNILNSQSINSFLQQQNQPPPTAPPNQVLQDLTLDPSLLSGRSLKELTDMLAVGDPTTAGPFGVPNLNNHFGGMSSHLGGPNPIGSERIGRGGVGIHGMGIVPPVPTSVPPPKSPWDNMPDAPDLPNGGLPPSMTGRTLDSLLKQQEGQFNGGIENYNSSPGMPNSAPPMASPNVTPNKMGPVAGTPDYGDYYGGGGGGPSSAKKQLFGGGMQDQTQGQNTARKNMVRDAGCWLRIFVSMFPLRFFLPNFV